MINFNTERCPDCQSQEIQRHTTYLTRHYGQRLIYNCLTCKSFFSETRETALAGLKTPLDKVITVVKTRTEGTSLNATSRIHGVSKNTIKDWEKRLAGLKHTLQLYALLNTFLELIVEGDELYTKVYKNVNPAESKGWTMVLMERGSRFIWELQCGRKDSKLFKKVLKILSQVIQQTQDLSLITDGERRYGNFLFELCNEVIKTGQRGRPKKTLKKGVKVRVKNKGSQRNKPGRKRPKYQAPHPEHPETQQNLTSKNIHANHVEGFNSSLRRRNSAYRRRTNTYAKKTERLQISLDVQWVVHNFVQVHFTTKEVPAVKLGILSRGLTWEELFRLKATVKSL